MHHEPVILAIETALRTNSISLLRGLREVESLRGESKDSRAEDLLELITVILKNNKIKLSELDLIAVSEGPGSFTGIRIGIATARALAFGGGRHLRGVSVLEAYAFGSEKNEVISAVRTGRNQIAWQVFRKSFNQIETVKSKPQVGTLREFFDEVLDTKEKLSEIILEPDLLDELKLFTSTHLNERINEDRIEVASDNVSQLIGQFSYHFTAPLAMTKELPQLSTVSPKYLVDAEIGRNKVKNSNE